MELRFWILDSDPSERFVANRDGWLESGYLNKDVLLRWYDRRSETITNERLFVWALREAAARGHGRVLFNHELANLIVRGGSGRDHAIAQLGLARKLARDAGVVFGSWGSPRDLSGFTFAAPELQGRRSWDEHCRELDFASTHIYHNDERTIDETIAYAATAATWLRTNHPGIPISCSFNPWVRTDGPGVVNYRAGSRDEIRQLTNAAVELAFDVLEYWSHVRADHVRVEFPDQIVGHHKSTLRAMGQLVPPGG